MIKSVKSDDVVIVDIYKGRYRPHSAIDFFNDFISEMEKISMSGGIIHNERKISVTLRCFIADAPVRAFISNYAGHNSKKPCLKWYVSGTYFYREKKRRNQEIQFTWV